MKINGPFEDASNRDIDPLVQVEKDKLSQLLRQTLFDLLKSDIFR
jgi:hypothetical protein